MIGYNVRFDPLAGLAVFETASPSSQRGHDRLTGNHESHPNP